MPRLPSDSEGRVRASSVAKDGEAPVQAFSLKKTRLGLGHARRDTRQEVWVRLRRLGPLSSGRFEAIGFKEV